MKILVFRRRVLVLAVLVLSAVVILAVFGNPAIVGAAAAKRQLPIYSVETDGEKRMSISFDAAWGNEDTGQLIEILDRYGIKATFFVVGDWVDKYPESVRQLHDAGHEVMNHSNKHKHMTQLSREEIIADVEACNEKIEAVTGVRPILFRAPYGEYDDKVITALYSIDMYTIQWDVDSIDWKDLSAGEIQARVLKKVQPGSIVLFHNAAKHTPEALPGLLDRLIADGYTLVPISELIYRENYEMDHTGRQHPVSAEH
ncbi:polysaccharide deacetylase family protein [Oscillospiraceae bacterium OttesenSCG-928-G22]|nr:polysaccharide deacetylase family protein [Oscillospiraceae bacterium OttesenSCG-928-G22]